LKAFGRAECLVVLGSMPGINFLELYLNSVLYFKTNKNTKQKYITAGSDFFKPSDEQHLLNYYEVPADILEDREALNDWAKEAMGV